MQHRFTMDGDDGWDEDFAQSLVGRTILVGITFLAADGETVEQLEEFHGVITGVERGVGVEIMCSGAREGEVQTLPPDLFAYEEAEPGVYTLRSPSDTVTDPEILSIWTVQAAAN